MFRKITVRLIRVFTTLRQILTSYYFDEFRSISSQYTRSNGSSIMLIDLHKFEIAEKLEGTSRGGNFKTLFQF